MTTPTAPFPLHYDYCTDELRPQAREIWNRAWPVVVGRLNAQKGMAYDVESGACYYRLPNPHGPDLCCGVGALIDGRDYVPDIEMTDPQGMLDGLPLECSPILLEIKDLEDGTAYDQLLHAFRFLQQAHDGLCDGTVRPRTPFGLDDWEPALVHALSQNPKLNVVTE